MFPGALNLEGLYKIKTFHEWDNRFTAPIHGFNDNKHYYESCSSLYVLNQIKIPTLLVNAHNDPFLSDSCFPNDKLLGDQVMLETPEFGGHCGFSYQFPNGRYYSEERAFHFFSNK